MLRGAGLGGGAGGCYLPGHSFLPTSPVQPPTFDLASRAQGELAQGQGGGAKGIQRRGAAAKSAPGRPVRIGGVGPHGPTWELRRFRSAAPLPAASRWAARGRRERTTYKCKGLIVVLRPRDTVVYAWAVRPGVSPRFAARTPFPAPTNLLYRANPDLSGCPWPSLST